MKNIKSCLLAILLATGIAGLAQAENNPLITLAENGTGSVVFPGGVAIPLPGALNADPGPGGLSSALSFNLLGPPGLIAGDIRLLDPVTHFLLDLIRFNPAGTGAAGYPASVVFYSGVDGTIDLADTGFPSSGYPNVLSFDEISTGNLYTPGATDPGFVPGFAVTYKFITDSAAVPEPATMALFGLGLIAFLVTRRRTAASIR